mmetsp:Transcript_30702/g.37369  ORF Transcript_30702/g.37369 Transcript_30702/m.37369 type:complete len:130 (-) Transcript_30702:232-621(-)
MCSSSSSSVSVGGIISRMSMVAMPAFTNTKNVVHRRGIRRGLGWRAWKTTKPEYPQTKMIRKESTSVQRNPPARDRYAAWPKIGRNATVLGCSTTRRGSKGKFVRVFGLPILSPPLTVKLRTFPILRTW